jgi:hypothetical protein
MRKPVLFLSLAFILSSGTALGQEKATPQQVVQKVQQAAGYLEKHGKTGLATFKERRSDYVWANTYVFVIDVNQRRRHLFRRSVEAEFSW